MISIPPPVVVLLLLAKACLAMQMRSSPQMDKLFVLQNESGCGELHPGKCAPYVVILGEDKCGTNAVAAYLIAMGMAHQTAEGCRRQYSERGWCGEVNWDFQKKPLVTQSLIEEYAVNFPDTDWEYTAAFDKSTVYFRQALQPGFIENFQTALPRSKLIAVLCDPVDRVWSRMQMLRETQGIHSDSKCLWNNQEELTEESGEQIMNHTRSILEQFDNGFSDKEIKECSDCQLLCMVLRTGDYKPQIKAWSNAYASSFRYFISEEIKSNPEKFIDELFDFLDYTGAKPRDQITDVGAVHTREADSSYWKKEGKLFEEFEALLTPRYQWNDVVSLRETIMSMSLWKRRSFR
jgi:hypothetical protein